MEDIKMDIQKVKEKNIQEDMLSRTSCKYAIVTLTIRLINSRYKDRGIILDIEGIRVGSKTDEREMNTSNRRNGRILGLLVFFILCFFASFFLGRYPITPKELIEVEASRIMPI